MLAGKLIKSAVVHWEHRGFTEEVASPDEDKKGEQKGREGVF